MSHCPQDSKKKIRCMHSWRTPEELAPMLKTCEHLTNNVTDIQSVHANLGHATWDEDNKSWHSCHIFRDHVIFETVVKVWQQFDNINIYSTMPTPHSITITIDLNQWMMNCVDKETTIMLWHYSSPISWLLSHKVLFMKVITPNFSNKRTFGALENYISKQIPH